MRINEILNEDLRKWFKEKWVRFGPDGKIRGDCARGSDSEGKPKCLPQSKAHSLGKKGRASAAARKRRQDPNPERRGKAKNVATKKKTNESESTKKFSLSDLDYYLQHPDQMSDKDFETEFGMTRTQAIQQFGFEKLPDTEEDDTDIAYYISHPEVMSDSQFESIFGMTRAQAKEQFLPKRWTKHGETIHESCPHCGGELVSEEELMEKKDACYYKVKSRYKVWPSAYASGALVRCRKKGAKNWGSKNKGA